LNCGLNLILGAPDSHSINQFDVGFFALDDWRARPNLTLSLGPRYEVQTRIGDHRNVAPRVGLALGLRHIIRGALGG
jgi:outer membrane receptor for ferrienterochelin and colicin